MQKPRVMNITCASVKHVPYAIGSMGLVFPYILPWKSTEYSCETFDNSSPASREKELSTRISPFYNLSMWKIISLWWFFEPPTYKFFGFQMKIPLVTSGLIPARSDRGQRYFDGNLLILRDHRGIVDVLRREEWKGQQTDRPLDGCFKKRSKLCSFKVKKLQVEGKYCKFCAFLHFLV